MVRRDSRIRALEPDQLPRGLRIGFPDPDAYAATVMTRQYMASLGIPVDEWFQVEYFGSQDSALLVITSYSIHYTKLYDVTRLR